MCGFRRLRSTRDTTANCEMGDCDRGASGFDAMAVSGSFWR